MSAAAKIFLVPTPELGRVEDVLPERVAVARNEWVDLSRHVFDEKRKAAASGWKPTQGEYLAADHATVKPFGAEHCPAMAELSTFGWLLKWPCAAILREVAPKAWQLKVPTQFNFYRYFPQTSFPERGEAETFLVRTGWLVVTPPGWSVLVKNVPNNLKGAPLGLTLAEGIVRADQATIPLFTHAIVQPNAPKEIAIERGKPMAVLFPFRREETELAIVDDPKIVDEAAKLAAQAQETFDAAPGAYKRLYVDGDNPSPLYERLLKVTG